MVTKEQKTEILKINAVTGIRCHHNGTVTAFKSYYFRNMGAKNLWDIILAKFPNAVLFDCGDHFHDFVGGAKPGSSKDSYIWVRFELR